MKKKLLEVKKLKKYFPIRSGFFSKISGSTDLSPRGPTVGCCINELEDNPGKVMKKSP